MLNRIFKSNFRIALPVLVLFGLTACSQQPAKNVLFERPGYHFPYQLTEPGQSWQLQGELMEISGLGFINSNRLACIQDEKAIIYTFNLGSGKVDSRVVFGDDGDYEGIEIVGDDAWVLKSNGMLFRVAGYLKEGVPVVNKYKTALTGKNDAEGLAYDPSGNSLLVACKENPYIGIEGGSGFKAVYSFNLEARQLDTEPFLLINPDTIKHYSGNTVFGPSGIAIQPATGNIFIVGSVGKLLLVFSAKGEILAVVKLNPMIFPQPEGICFSPEGTLYISNEGAGRGGTILKFSLNNTVILGL